MAVVELEARTEPLELLSDLVARAMRRGVTAADAVHIEGIAMSVSQNMGTREDLVRSEGGGIGLRVFFGKRQALTSTTDYSRAALETLLERTIAMARATPEDPYAGLAEPELLATTLPDLDLFDAHEPSGEELYARAAAAEGTALAVHGVTNSAGASANWVRGSLALVTSHGFVGTGKSSAFGVSVAVIAGGGTSMEMDYAFSSARHLGDLEPAEQIGGEAGRRAVRRLNPHKPDSKAMPVVFEPRIANGMLGCLEGAINGATIARGSSFLRNEMGKQVCNPGITIVDDPLRRRGLGSRAFDAEGVRSRRLGLVEDGVLQTWLLSSADARQLGLRSTGHAARGLSSPPGPASSNLFLEAGKVTPDELMSDVRRGVYLTNVYGDGIDIVTGDYSLGAAGFLIKNGNIGEPISEFTIAGNLRDMFRNMTAANDLVFRYGHDAPTLRIDGMTVAGT